MTTSHNSSIATTNRSCLFLKIPALAWAFSAALLITATIPSTHAEDWIISKNPYEAVDWEKFGQHKGNLHTHTTNSDGRHSPQEVIDAYHEEGYEILAITDHNHVTWPWEDYERDPEQLLMVAVVGNELSRHRHTNSLFTEYPEPIRSRSTNNLSISLREVEELGGLTFLCHPGRYWNPRDGAVDDGTLEFHAGLFKEYPNLIGFEIHNQGDRYPEDRLLWDALLTEFMPRRPIWGFANDDTHRASHVALNATIFILPELTLENVRLALIQGQFFSSTITTQSRDDRDWKTTPSIANIEYDRDAGTLTIEARIAGEPAPQDAYTWISANGKKVHEGNTIDLNNTDDLDRYLRAEIKGPGGTTYTQPFGVRQRE